MSIIEPFQFPCNDHHFSLSQVAVADLRSKQPLEHPGPADHTFYFLLADEEEGASFNLVNINEDTINDGTILYNMIEATW